MGASEIEIVFRSDEWHDEVERYDRSATARILAQKARRTIETGGAKLRWQRCRGEDGPSRTKLPHCLKLYLPLNKEGASDAPYGFVFQLQRMRDGSPMLNFIAFGERHPDNRATRTVYERAHKRLHGHYP